MKKAFIFGIDGKMGKMLCDCAADYGYMIVGGFDKQRRDGNAPVFDDAKHIDVDFDVIIDFSNPALLCPIIALEQDANKPIVIATTGYNDSELKTIRMLAQKVPVFRSSNMSLGIAAAKAAALTVKSILGDAFDIEIVEKHHNRKIDSPSGTAILLADALSPRENQVFNREGKRKGGEVGITSVRGGGVVGEHEIGFYGEDEIVTVSHSARSRKLFAAGAYKAADFLLTAPPALYDMDDLVKTLTY